MGRNLLVALVICLGAGCATSSQRQAAPLEPLPPLTAAALDEGQIPFEELYTLRPGDTVRVKFLYHPELDVMVPVRPDGKIDLMGIGEVKAEGLTANEVAAEVRAMASDTLRDPEVTIIVAELGARPIYVTGEVRNPGVVQFREGITALQAIVDRGGFTEVAQTDNVLHLHRGRDQWQPTVLNFEGTIQQGSPELRHLAANDVIYVPRNFIGDANAFVRLWIRGLIPAIPRVGVGLNP